MGSRSGASRTRLASRARRRCGRRGSSRCYPSGTRAGDGLPPASEGVRSTNPFRPARSPSCSRTRRGGRSGGARARRVRCAPASQRHASGLRTGTSSAANPGPSSGSSSSGRREQRSPRSTGARLCLKTSISPRSSRSPRSAGESSATGKNSRMNWAWITMRGEDGGGSTTTGACAWLPIASWRPNAAAFPPPQAVHSHSSATC